MGAERKSMLLTDEEKRVTAYHEAGHALVSFRHEHSDPIHKVTIIPRGMALGVTIFLPGDRHNYTREYLEANLAISYGGRVAEEIFLNQMSTGAGSDIESATDLARRMVCEYGMSRLGPLTFGKKEEQIFLGREIAQHRDFSEETARQIDLEVRRLIDEAYQSAHAIVESHADAMHRIAAALLERETIDAEEVRMLIEGRGPGIASVALHPGLAQRYRRWHAASAQAGRHPQRPELSRGFAFTGITRPQSE
jgi:cell division protease FtsH